MNIGEDRSSRALDTGDTKDIVSLIHDTSAELIPPFSANQYSDDHLDLHTLL